MKVKIEWKDGNVFRPADADLKHTRNNNGMCMHSGQVLVFPSLKEGAEVVGLANGKWTRCGRVTRDLIFLGEGLSYSEMNEKLFKGKKVEEDMERATLHYIIGWIALRLRFTKNTEWHDMILTKLLIRFKGSLVEMPKTFAETTYALINGLANRSGELNKPYYIISESLTLISAR